MQVASYKACGACADTQSTALRSVSGRLPVSSNVEISSAIRTVTAKSCHHAHKSITGDRIAFRRQHSKPATHHDIGFTAMLKMHSRIYFAPMLILCTFVNGKHKAMHRR